MRFVGKENDEHRVHGIDPDVIYFNSAVVTNRCAPRRLRYMKQILKLCLMCHEI